MPNDLPYIILCTAAAKPNARLAMAAVGLGPDTFPRDLAPAMPAPTSSTTPTYHLTQDMSGTDDQVVMLNAMTLGVLPENDIYGNPIAWGEEGIISEADAIAAFGGGNVQIRPASGLVLVDGQPDATARDTWRDDTLTVMGLAFIPPSL